MKKTLAIVVSFVLVVAAAFCVFALTSGADEVFASTVQIVLPDGTNVYLGAQPVFGDPDSPTTITGYDATNVVSTYAPASGSMSFDHATGTLTITDVQGVAQIRAMTGSLTLIVKGTNTLVNATGNNSVFCNYLEYVDPNASTKVIKAVGNLVIKGDGTLNTSCVAYGIVSQHGSLTITGDVTVNATTTGTSGNCDVLHCSTSSSQAGVLTISGNATVVANSNAYYAIRAQGSEGAVVFKDNCDVTVNAVVTAGWKGGVCARNFEMLGGKVTVNVENEASAKAQAFVGFDLQNGTAKFSGGDLTVNVNNKNNNRGYGLFLKSNSEAVVFSGTDVTIDVKNSTNNSSNAIIGAQGTCPAINITDGDFKFTGDNNTAGLFGLNSANMSLNISGGTFSGTAKSFVYSQGVDATVNITGGTFDVSSTSSNFTYSNTSKVLTQTASDTSFYFIDAAAKTFKAPLAVPTNVASSDVTSSSAKITWTAVEGAASYKVYVNGTVAATVAEASATIDVLPETAYSVTVSAVSAKGAETAVSAAATFTTPAGQTAVVPAVPTGVAVPGAAQTTASVTWTAVDGATSYNVYVNGQKVDTVYEASATLSGLTANTSYTVAVSAVNAAGESAKTADVSFKTLKEGAVSEVTVTMADGTEVVLNATNTSVNGATGTIVFDIAKSTVTLTDVTGVQSVIAAKNVDLIIEVKGTNTLVSDVKANMLCAYNLILEGDGVLNITSTKSSGSYTVLGQNSVTVRGDVTVNVTAAQGPGFHAARGNASDTVSTCFFLAEDNAKVNVKASNGMGIYVVGQNVSVTITDKAEVTVNSSSDGIQIKSDTYRTSTLAPSASLEVSGNAKLTVVGGSCGIRCSFAISGTNYPDSAAVAGSAIAVFKGNSVADITGIGQVIYVNDASSGNTAKNTATFQLLDNASVKATNNGTNYCALQLNSDENTMKVTGGTLELIAPNKNAFTVNGKITYEIADGFKTFVAGNDADSAKDVLAMNTSAKYIKLAYGKVNAGTSDSAAAIFGILALAMIASAAAVVLRKKAHN